MERTFYFISGLGADERLFRNLRLNGDSIYINWIEPFPYESLSSYAFRLKDQIREKDDAILIGVSLGGILAVELAKKIPLSCVIIISSIKTRSELPLSYRLLSKVSFLVRLFPYSIMRKFPYLLYYHMGAHTKEERDLLDRFMKETDEDFVHWGTEQVIRWKNKDIPPNVFHIHGTADRVFPFSRIRNAVEVKGGTHLMVFSRAEEISRKIEEIAGRAIAGLK
jgi:pimeloyl-ACP methyl ester carboxylesterase